LPPLLRLALLLLTGEARKGQGQALRQTSTEATSLGSEHQAAREDAEAEEQALLVNVGFIDSPQPWPGAAEHDHRQRIIGALPPDAPASEQTVQLAYPIVVGFGLARAGEQIGVSNAEAGELERLGCIAGTPEAEARSRSPRELASVLGLGSHPDVLLVEPSTGKVVGIDIPVAPAVATLWRWGVATYWSYDGGPERNLDGTVWRELPAMLNFNDTQCRVEGLEHWERRDLCHAYRLRTLLQSVTDGHLPVSWVWTWDADNFFSRLHLPGHELPALIAVLERAEKSSRDRLR
jgi:hypothetical protein